MIQPTQKRLARVAGSRVLTLGMLLAALMAAFLLLAEKPAHAATTFTVNSTGDKNDLDFPGGAFDGSSDGKCFTGDVLVVQGEECTLRAAIQEANVTPGADAINFAIPGTGVATISPATALPTITGPVSINGYSQPGAKPNTKAVGSDAVLKIELSGAGAPEAYGLQIGAANSTVKGLVINRWLQGIRISGSASTGNRVTGNHIGTDATGTQDLGNSRGVYIPDAANNTIGGATAAERNVISGNGEIGVCIDAGAGVNKVMGNYIGTDASGTKDLGNSSSGVLIEGAPNNTVGGTTAGARNIISGNDEYGVSIYAKGNKVMGNYIGTDASGTKDLGNSYHGVLLKSASDTIIGGTTAAERNVISGNNSEGVRITGTTGTDNKVAGNYVGTDVSGTKDLGNSSIGVNINNAKDNTVGGATAGARNVISGNNSHGVLIFGVNAPGNKVMGNFIGTDKNGIADLGNSYHGVFVYAPNNTIGGTTAAARNVISGNEKNGVYIENAGATGNKVAGNYIGTDASGTKDLGNSLDGVVVFRALNTTIGGTTAAARNVISGNDGGGITIKDAAAIGNLVTGNYVGTDRHGAADLGNSGAGVLVQDARSNNIGGVTVAERNVISGNGGNGVFIVGANATGNQIIGNYIGTANNGTAPLGNSGAGVVIGFASSNNVGGTVAGARNVISANNSGVLVFGANAAGNRILANSMFSNTLLGMDLGGDGITANDLGDADTGPNTLQNKPLLTSAKTSSVSTTVRGTLNSTPNKTFVVQFFSSPSGDEGKTFRGQKSVTTNSSGNASFTFSPASKVGVGQRMTATATDASGNTSEFSAPRTVVAQ